MIHQIRRSTLVVASLTLAVTSLVGVPLLAVTSSTASAAIGVCRSDPVFTLANGQTVTLNESITDVKSDITGGSYVLHIPSGRRVSSVSYSGAVGSKQSLTWTADQPANTFSATSTVLTNTSKVAVTAYMSVGSKNSSSASGVSNAPIPNKVVTG